MDTHAIAPVLDAIKLVREYGYDMVVGKREPVKGDGTRAETFRFGHNLGNTLLTKTFRLLFPVPINDSLSDGE
ncbi:MAG: hypothetical protein WDO06_05420 [Actinomycetota bacterium]